MVVCLVVFFFFIEGVPVPAQCTGISLEHVLPALQWCMAAFRSSSTHSCGTARHLPGSARTPRAQCQRVAEKFCSFVIHNWRLPHWLPTVSFSVLKPKVGGCAHAWLMTSFVIHHYQYLWSWDLQCSKDESLSAGNTALCLAVNATQQETALWNFCLLFPFREN